MSVSDYEVRIIKGDPKKTGKRLSPEDEGRARRTELEERKRAEAALRAKAKQMAPPPVPKTATEMKAEFDRLMKLQSEKQKKAAADMDDLSDLLVMSLLKAMVEKDTKAAIEAMKAKLEPPVDPLACLDEIPL